MSVRRGAPLRVLLIGPDPFDPRAAVGPPLYLRTLIGGLRARSDVELAVLSFVRRGPSATGTTEGVSWCRVGEPRVASTVLTPIAARTEVARRVRAFAPDVVDLHEPERAAVLGSCRVPVVSTVHAILPELLAHGLLPAWKRPLAPIIRRAWLRGLARSRRVVALSERDRRLLGDFGIAEVDVVPVPRGAECFVPAQAREEAPALLTVGVVGQRKNQLAAARALSAVADRRLRLRIVGGAEGAGGARACARIREEARLRGVEDRIDWLGPLPHATVLEELRRAAVFVLLSHQETAPAAVVEALACGTPVVASRIPAHEELVADGETGFLVEPDDWREVAHRIDRLLADRALRLRVGAAARAAALARHGLDPIVARRLRILADVARV